MTPFQRQIYLSLIPGVWYETIRDQSGGGAPLPAWFLLRQRTPIRTLQPMVNAGHLEMREERTPGGIVYEVRRPMK